MNFYLQLLLVVISILTFAWKIFSFFYHRKKSLKINYEFFYDILYNNRYTTICDFFITNGSPMTISINEIGFTFDKNSFEYYSPIGHFLTEPVLLKSGQSTSHSIVYSDLVFLIQRVKPKRFKLIIKDTQGKEYKSCWIKISKFLEEKFEPIEIDIQSNPITF